MSRRRQAQALTAAVDLLRIPSQVRTMRSAPLPRGVLLLLRLAAEDAEAESEAEIMSKRAPDAHRDAAIFFIEQILLAENSDAFRTLGLDKSATNAEMRRHMVYLLKWLHPDRNADSHKARLARRVLLAWNELKATKRMKVGDTRPDDRGKDRGGFRYTRKRSLSVQRARPRRREHRSANALSKRLKRRFWPT